MKKVILGIVSCIVILGTVALLFSNKRSLLDSNVAALADVDPFMYWCNKYCDDNPDYSCTIENIIDVPFTCMYMSPKH